MAGCQGRSEGAEHVQDADEEQQLAAAEVVGGAATDERADDGADGGDGDGGAQAPVVEVELDFERGVGSGDDGGVETEDQAANGGDNGAADDERTRLGGDLCAVGHRDSLFSSWTEAGTAIGVAGIPLCFRVASDEPASLGSVVRMA